jgi:hypothetical protein
MFQGLSQSRPCTAERRCEHEHDYGSCGQLVLWDMMPSLTSSVDPADRLHSYRQHRRQGVMSLTLARRRTSCFAMRIGEAEQAGVPMAERGRQQVADMAPVIAELQASGRCGPSQPS